MTEAGVGGRKRFRVAVLPGDDSAPEAVYATLDVLDALDLPIDWEVLPDGDELVAKGGDERERVVREAVDRSDTVLFGATSGKTGGVAYLRWGKGAYANVRPVRYRPGVPSPLREPEGIDYVIVRENIEDLYCGLEGDLATLQASGLDLRPFGGLLGDLPAAGMAASAAEGRFAMKIITREGTERAAHFACRLALERRAAGHQGKVTCATKHNVLFRSDGFFRDVVRDVVATYPDLTFESYLADDFSRRLVASPRELDVVLLPNLYGDLFSDEGAGTIGGLGLCPSGCYGQDFAYFEPVHGTAPDIVGQHAINPIATILSAAMLLAHLGLDEAAARLEAAVDSTLAAGDSFTPDIGGTATTDAMAKAVRSRL